MIQKFTKKVGMAVIAALLIGVNLFAAGGMKDIELTPGKVENHGNMMKVFPTIATDDVTVHFFFETDDQVTLNVFDMQGRQVATDHGYVPALRTHEAIVDVSSMAPGVYFVKLTQAHGTSQMTKIVVQH
jgi:hypothetical protein